MSIIPESMKRGMYAIISPLFIFGVKTWFFLSITPPYPNMPFQSKKLSTPASQRNADAIQRQIVPKKSAT